MSKAHIVAQQSDASSPSPPQVGPNRNVKVHFTAAMSRKLAIFFETRSFQFCILNGHTREIHTNLWDIQPCSLVEGCGHLPETYHRHLQSRSLSQASNHQEDSRNGCLLDFLTPMVEAVCSSETSLNVYQTTRRYIPKNSTLPSHRHENPKSN